MRILGFGKRWPKLDEQEFTTFRFKRRDKRDWAVGELVQIVLHPRSPSAEGHPGEGLTSVFGGRLWPRVKGEKRREVLGVAKIIGKEPRSLFSHGRVSLLRSHYHAPLSEEEARQDGFEGWESMLLWLIRIYGRERLLSEPMNKLTLRWETKGEINDKVKDSSSPSL